MAETKLGKDAVTLPVGTTAQRPSNPEAGMIRFNTDEGYVEWYDDVGDRWTETNRFEGIIELGMNQEVLMPGQPAFDVFDSSRSVGSTGQVVFDGVKTNIGNAYDSSTGVFTAPSSGIYLFAYTCGDSSDFVTDLEVNGQSNRRNERKGDGVAFFWITVSVVVELQANDNVTVTVQQGASVRFSSPFGGFSGYLLS